MSSSKVKVSFSDFMLESRGLVKLGGFSGEDLALYLWWIRLATKIAVSGRMELLEDMATDEKR